MNIIQKIKELNFPPDQYVVVGSGIGREKDFKDIGLIKVYLKENR